MANKVYPDPESYKAYYAMKDLIAFLGRLCNNYSKLYQSFLKDFEFHYRDEYEECYDCGRIGVNGCVCVIDFGSQIQFDIYNDEADF